MNPNFRLVPDCVQNPVKGEGIPKGSYNVEAILRLFYKDTCIARWQGRGEECDLYADAQKYLATHGYMAEHRRQWNNGNKINWSEEIRVHV